MIKHISILILLSFLFLLFVQQAQLVISYLALVHGYLNAGLSNIFSTSPVGNALQETLCLLVIPFVIVGFPAAIYYLFKRKLIPYFYHMVWGVWIVLFTSLILTN